MAKIDRAVNETKDKILTYEHEPINATFFSTSNGYTENSEDYWPFKSPYLRSVPSPWDIKLSSRYQETVDQLQDDASEARCDEYSDNRIRAPKV